MAFSLVAKISCHLQRAAFYLSRTHDFNHFCPSNNASFIFHGWAAPARAFCTKPKGVHNDSTKSLDSVMESKSDEVVQNAESHKTVLYLLNKKFVHEIKTFPSEILGSDERLFELFEVWMVENKRTYPSEKEKMRRFWGFKDNAIHVHQYNSNLIIGDYICLNLFADHLPDDPYMGAQYTAEDVERMKYNRPIPWGACS